MPLFLLRYMSAKFEVVGLAIIEAKDPILARRKAEVDEIHQPGLPAVVDELDPASISPDLIGSRLSLDECHHQPAAGAVGAAAVDPIPEAG
jgi:hypothetical protein